MGAANGDRNSDKLKMKKKKKKSKELGDATTKHETEGKADEKKIVEDPRFSSMHSDPRFQKVPKRQTKVAIDERFSRMFTDKSFGSSSAVHLDKRGKKKKKNNKSASLKHYYQLAERDESDAEESSLSDSSNDDLEEIVEEGESSTTDEDDLDYEDDAIEEEENVPIVEEATRRLAVVDLDWKHIRAVDLLILLRSCLPKGGDILSVSVYPSEFGLKQMKEEEIKGPVGLFDENDDDEDKEIDYEKLRAYEKSRLRYYYAVVECDTVATADHLYKFCDGSELERSSNVLDLRFIPDSMEFKHPPRDVATDAPSNYEGLDFHTKALQHSNIPVSWDEDEPQRVKKLNRHFKSDEMAELELKEFLASDGSESEGGEKYRALLESGDDAEKDEEQDMEVTFNPELEDLSKHLLEKKMKKSESVWEEYLKKRSEKRKARKRKAKHEESESEGDDFFVEESGKSEEAAATQAELELLVADEDGDAKGFNLKRKKGKKVALIKEDKIPSVNLEDPRFSKMFASPLFALDPTDPQFKRSAAYARLAVQKQSSQIELPIPNVPPSMDDTADLSSLVVGPPSMDDRAHLSSLVTSIKRKSKLRSKKT